MRVNRFQQQAGFSMVEVALAIFVLSIGLLAMLGLFADGLDTNKKTIDDTQCALFADEVLNGFRAAAQTNVANWTTYLQSITMSNPAIWIASAPIVADNTVRTNLYQYTPTNAALGQLTDYTYLYRLSVAAVGGNTNIQGVTLMVLPGTSRTTTNFYYTEVYNFGM